jgi:transposase-like protein
MPSLFDDDDLARRALEALRWPEGPRCTRAHCGATGNDVFLIGGEKQSHRDGLYHCKRCRKQFSVTVGTVFERSRIRLSTWMRAAHAFSVEAQPLPTLSNLGLEIGISYKTVLRMRDIIKQAAKRYKGHKAGFGAWPRSFMKSRAPRLQNYRERKIALMTAGKHPSQHTIKSTGVLVPYAPARGVTEAALKRTESLLRLLLAQGPK